METYTKKIALVGDWGTGKTSLIRRYVLNAFDDSYIQTIGTKVSKKVVDLRVGEREIRINLMIWDILGQRDYRSVQKNAFVGVEGAIFVCDLTRRETLDSIEKYWHPLMVSVVGEKPAIIVANKCDLINVACFSLEDVRQVAKAVKINPEGCYLSSAKTGENVEKIFMALATLMMTAPPKETAYKERVKALEKIEAEDEVNYKTVLDALFLDFTKTIGSEEKAMEILNACFRSCGLSLKYPTREGIELLIETMRKAEVENGVKPETAEQNKLRRLKLLESVE
ncbi:MAG: GTP-binding protein [Thermoplasmata archaeon]|nr:GTP-binding protein [Thermoplasmata archaeon]